MCFFSDNTNSFRPFTVALIPNTNLILVVADTTCPCYSARETVAPTKVRVRSIALVKQHRFK